MDTLQKNDQHIYHFSLVFNCLLRNTGISMIWNVRSFQIFYIPIMTFTVPNIAVTYQLIKWMIIKWFPRNENNSVSIYITTVLVHLCKNLSIQGSMIQLQHERGLNPYASKQSTEY